MIPTRLCVIGSALTLFTARVCSVAVAQEPRYRLEISLDRTGGVYMYGTQARYVDREEIMNQSEAVNLAVTASRLVALSGPLYGRLGVGIGDKGYREEVAILATGAAEWRMLDNRIHMIYAGIPVTAGYSLLGNNRRLRPYVEGGVSFDVLLWGTESEYWRFDLRPVGASYVGGLGLQYSRPDALSLSLGVEARLGVVHYDTEANLRPIATGIRLAVQF